MNANKLFLDYLFQFWDENWDKIDRSTIHPFPESLDDFKKQLRRSKYDRYWSILELADWGMSEDYNREHSVLRYYNPDLPISEIPQGYVFWQWRKNGFSAPAFLIDLNTYDAYEVRYTEEIVKYRLYKPVK